MSDAASKGLKGTNVKVYTEYIDAQPKYGVVLHQVQPKYGVVVSTAPDIQPKYGVVTVQPKYGVVVPTTGVQPAYGVQVPTTGLQPAYGVQIPPTVVQPAYGVQVPGGQDINITFSQLEENIATLKKAIASLKSSWDGETKKNLSTLDNSWVGQDCAAYTAKLTNMDGKVQNTISALELLCSTYEKARDMVKESQSTTISSISNM